MKKVVTLIFSLFLFGCGSKVVDPAALEQMQSRKFQYSASQVMSAIHSYHRDRGWECDHGYMIISCHSRKWTDHYKYELTSPTPSTSIVRLVMLKGGGFLESDITQVTFNGIDKQILRDQIPFVPREAK